MRLKERLIKEIETLSPDNVLKIYNIIINLKKKDNRVTSDKKTRGYLRVRAALKSFKCSFSDAISEERNDRL